MEIKRLARLALVTAFAFIAHFAAAQTTSYYQLKEIVHNDNVDRNCTGGQFITFVGNICFDSDKAGKSVGNGQLFLDRTATGRKTYMGSSYHGRVKYKFSYDLSQFEIEINPYHRYVYVKATPPTGVTTSSLIKRSSSGGGSYVPQTPPVYGPDPGPVYNPQPQQPSSSGVSSSTPTAPAEPRKFRCPQHCQNGRIAVTDDSVASFGMPSVRKHCDECGFNYSTPTVHYHMQCPTCHGTGWVTYN